MKTIFKYEIDLTKGSPQEIQMPADAIILSVGTGCFGFSSDRR